MATATAPTTAPAETEDHQPAQSGSRRVAEQDDTGDTGDHRLADDEGSGGSVYRTELQRHGEQIEAAQPGDEDRPTTPGRTPGRPA